MALSNDLISQFVRVTNDRNNTEKETTIVYGTAHKIGNNVYVKIDGSDILTPVSHTADVVEDERVTVMIKNHTATITGNITSPAARSTELKDIGTGIDDKLTAFKTMVADKVTTEQLSAESARIDILVTDNAKIYNTLDAYQADIDKLEAADVTITDTLTANTADITTLKTTKLDVSIANATYATIDSLEAVEGEFHTLESTYGEFADLTTDRLNAIDATLVDLDVENLSATYANIDFSNINTAAIEKMFAGTGLIQNIIVGDGTITGRLVGVTISGDLIEGNTVVADKLVVKGSDGLYYKLNTDGITVEAEQTDQNSLNGSVIKAKSITASKIDVKDLVAFNATIGGFRITESSIYSGAKATAENTTQGIYLDKEGQLSVGDANNYLRYYKTSSGAYKLEISSVDNLVVGGRNLFGFNKNIDLSPLANANYASVEFNEDIKGFVITIKADTPATTIITRAHRLGFNGVAGESYTFSGKVYTNANTTQLSFDICDKGNEIFTVDSNPKKISFTAVPENYYTSTTYNGFLDVSVPGGVTIPAGTIIYFQNVKIERGNQATDWTPAPEDLATNKSLNSAVASFESKIQQSSNSIMTSVSATYATKDSVTNLEVGGRNLLLDTASPLEVETVDEAVSRSSTKLYAILPEIKADPKAFLLSIENSYLAFSYDIEVDSIYKDTNQELNRIGGYFTFNITNNTTGTTVSWYGTHSSGISANNNNLGSANSLINVSSEEPVSYNGHYAGYCDMSNGPTILKSFYANPDNYTVSISSAYVEIRGITTGGVIKNVKLEVGNKPTRWSPAPEDMATGQEVDTAQTTADDAKESAHDAKTSIAQLSDSISMLVTDGNGTSLMTQTENGWTFSTAGIQASVNTVSENLGNLTNELDDTSHAVDVLKQAVADLGEIAEYVKIGTYEGQPCIELGEGDSEFKLRITNTQIMFMEGSNIVAHINNQSLHIKKAVIEEELQQGGFVWKVRSNGNMGLVWKGVSS